MGGAPIDRGERGISCLGSGEDGLDGEERRQRRREDYLYVFCGDEVIGVRGVAECGGDVKGGGYVC